ncbi:hypothetical protein [Williamsia sp.]|uniref:hypothetical protein n=1 Tax=Williamsia sp. TaxID=1872085 RepID=UPI002F92A8A4
MKRLGFVTITVSVLAAVGLGPASPVVTAAPAGPGTAQDTMDSLHAGGYTVILKQVGDAPLDECSVTKLGPDHTAFDASASSPAVCLHVRC